jgi:hypothetical protein
MVLKKRTLNFNGKNWYHFPPSKIKISNQVLVLYRWRIEFGCFQKLRCGVTKLIIENWVKPGLEKTRVGKNPVFFKKTQPSGFFGFFWFFFGFFGFFWVFLGFFARTRGFLGFFPVSRILLGASRL